MIWMAALIGLGAGAIALWHMQRPRPPRIEISFLRFVPALPPAPAQRSRIVLARPRDGLPLALLLGAALALIVALVLADRLYRAALPDHLGLRIVLDRSGSMAVEDGGQSRYASALARLAEARRRLEASGARVRCVEVIGVGAGIGAPVALPQGSALPAALASAPLREGSEPGALLQAAAAPGSESCALTHVLVISDAAAPETGLDTEGGAGGPVLIWQQIGAPVGNSGLRQVSLASSAFGQSQPEIRIEGISSGAALPERLILRGPGGETTLPVWPLPDAEGRWYAVAPHAGPGDYEAVLPEGEGGGYRDDDRVRLHLGASGRAGVDWQLTGLPRPPMLEAGEDLLVTEAFDPAADATFDPALNPAQAAARPVLIAYPGFSGPPDNPHIGRHIGAFRDDPALLGALNLDALEAVLPRPYPGPLPTGFVPVLADDRGGVLIARRETPPGLILPAPVPQASEPARNVSLTLFFSALADALALPPARQEIVWIGADGAPVPEAWRESATGRALVTSETGAETGPDFVIAGATPRQMQPLWPWAVCAALAAVLLERLLRVARLLLRKESL